MTTLSLKMLTKDSDLQRYICEQVCEHINRLALSKRRNIEKAMRDCVEKTLTFSPQWQLLLNDTPERMEMGISKEQVAQIIHDFAESCIVWLNTLIPTMGGRLSTQPFMLLKSERLDQIPEQYSSVITKKNQALPIVEWLQRGEESIIAGFMAVEANAYEKIHISRQGYLMKPSTTVSWHVPYMLSGDSETNIFSVPLTSDVFLDELTSIIEQEFTR